MVVAVEHSNMTAGDHLKGLHKKQVCTGWGDPRSIKGFTRFFGFGKLGHGGFPSLA